MNWMDSSTIDFRIKSLRLSMLSSDPKFPALGVAALQKSLRACLTVSRFTVGGVSTDFSSFTFSRKILLLLAVMRSMLVSSLSASIVSKRNSSLSGVSSSLVAFTRENALVA